MYQEYKRRMLFKSCVKKHTHCQTRTFIETNTAILKTGITKQPHKSQESKNKYIPSSRLVPVGENDQNPPEKINEIITQNPLYIGTFNVRSLASTRRYIELMYSLQKIKIDILGLAEVRRMGCCIEEHEDFIFCYKGETPGLHGVGFLIKKEYKNNILNFSGLSERVALLQLEFNKKMISIIQVYAPTEKASKEEIDKFYNTLQEAQTQAGENVLLIGDFNAKVGLAKTNEDTILGKFGYGKRNERGEKLIEFAIEHKLSVMNTYFKMRHNRKWTWISPNGKVKNEVDFILSNQPKKVRKIEVLHGLGFSSDHRLIRATYLLQNCKKSRKSFKSSSNKFKTEEAITLYTRSLENNTNELEKLEDDEDVQTLYNKIEHIIKNSMSMEQQEEKQFNVNKILTKSTIELITRRSELIKLKHKTKEMKEELSTLFKRSSKAIKQDYADYRKLILETNLKQYGSTKRAYKQLVTHKNWIQNLKTRTTGTNTRKDIIDCATEFYKDLYKSNVGTCTCKNEYPKNYSDIEVEPAEVDVMEIVTHIKKLKTEKSPGPDEIPNEALKIGFAWLARPLSYLFSKIINTGQIPKQWKKSDIILLYKKGDPQDIGNYRPISLLPSTYKLFTSILLSRISGKIEKHQPIEQAGFRSGFSTVDHLHVMQQITEKYKEFNRPLYVAFIDYAKAFDTISHDAIWEALNKCQVHEKYKTVLKNIYDSSTSCVKLEKRGPEIPILRGVRQGDPLSPKIFIAVLQNIFEDLKWINEGIKIGNRYLSHLRFADDIVLFAENSRQLETMINLLSVQSEKVGLLMNKEKTKLMTNSYTHTIKLEGKTLEYVNKYIYLGKQLSFEDRNEEEEVERRINMSWKKYWSLKEIMKGDYPLHLKKKVMDTCILPTLTYGCQTRTYTTKIKTKLIRCQKAMERSLLKIRRIHKVRSELIRKKTKLIDVLHYSLRLKWRWAGHVARNSDKRWTVEATRWKGPSGKRRKGRPMKRWLDDIIATAGKEWMKHAKNRENWNKLEEAYTQIGVPILENN